MAGGLNGEERALAAELISPLIVANSSFSETLTAQARAKAAEAIDPVTAEYTQNETIVFRGQKITPVAMEAINHFGLTEARPDVARLGGWFLMSLLIVGLLLGWIWRFRRAALASHERARPDRADRRRDDPAPEADGRSARVCRSSCRPRRPACSSRSCSTRASRRSSWRCSPCSEAP